MLHAQSGEDEFADIRDIHALAPPLPSPLPATAIPGRRGESLESGSGRLSELSGENLASMSREFGAIVTAGSTAENAGSILANIGEEEEAERDRLAIIPDAAPFEHFPSSAPAPAVGVSEGVSITRVKKEEVESKISAWQTAKIAEINNRFKRDEAVIGGWESGEVDKAATRLKKVERKLEEKRAKAWEKMQNEVAKARQKADEKRASSEAKRGTKVARVLDVANLMKAVGRAPAKHSFF